MGSDSEDTVSGDAYMVGPLDMILLVSFVGFLVYWFMGKKKENKPEITGLAGLTRLSAPMTQADTSGFLSKMKKGGISCFIVFVSNSARFVIYLFGLKYMFSVRSIKKG